MKKYFYLSQRHRNGALSRITSTPFTYRLLKRNPAGSEQSKQPCGLLRSTHKSSPVYVGQPTDGASPCSLRRDPRRTPCSPGSTRLQQGANTPGAGFSQLQMQTHRMLMGSKEMHDCHCTSHKNLEKWLYHHDQDTAATGMCSLETGRMPFGFPARKTQALLLRGRNRSSISGHSDITGLFNFSISQASHLLSPFGTTGQVERVESNVPKNHLLYQSLCITVSKERSI